MGQVSDSDKEAIYALRKVFKLQPDNQQAIDRLDALLGITAQATVKDSSAAPRSKLLIALAGIAFALVLIACLGYAWYYFIGL